jgi:chromosome segregation ATPase
VARKTGSGSSTTPDDASDGLSIDTLQAIVELQRTELTRLLREQSRLNDRIDSLLQLHEREQVLRQQMQASLDRLAAAQIAASRQPAQISRSDRPEASAGVAGLRARLERTEARFSALQEAVGSLVTQIERSMTERNPAPAEATFVRVYAPGS